MSTNSLAAKDIKRDWHLIDASSQVVGRLSSQIAKLLQGKHKKNYVPYLDSGDFVVITNAAKVKISGKKVQQKKYISHSGYPGGLKEESFSSLLQRRPTEIIYHAVKGMLPKNKLGNKMIKKLYIYPGENHPHKNLGAQKD